MKTALVVGLAVIAQAAANTLLSKGMKVIASMPSFSSGFSPLMLAYALKSPFIWGGIFLLIVFFACFLALQSFVDGTFDSMSWFGSRDYAFSLNEQFGCVEDVYLVEGFGSHLLLLDQ